VTADGWSRSAPDPRDRDWTDRIRRGDRGALEELFEAYYPRFMEFAIDFLHARGGVMPADQARQDASDAVHDVLLDLWCRRMSLDPQAGVIRYVYAAIRNRAFDMLTGRGRDRRTLVSLEDLDETVLTSKLESRQTISPLDEPEEWDRLYAAIAALAPGRRTVILLRWQTGYSFAEIAAILGVSVRSAETQHLRAMNDLRERLKKTEG
jgi:RNA polymerase sigma factor (sigma-70 family)